MKLFVAGGGFVASYSVHLQVVGVLFGGLVATGECPEAQHAWN